MVVAVPVLFASISFTSRESARWLVVWLGTTGCIIHQGVLFLFGTPFNSLSLIYVAMLSLGIWSAVVLVRRIDLQEFTSRFDAKLPARTIAIYTATLAALKCTRLVANDRARNAQRLAVGVPRRLGHDDESGVRSRPGRVASAVGCCLVVAVEASAVG